MSRGIQMMDVHETNQLLETMRGVCDPLADQVIRELFERGQVASANGLMAHLMTHGGMVLERLPEPLRGYFERSGRMPPWMDHELLSEGQALFHRCGPLSVVALVGASLPTCYAGAQGVQVLHLTSRMETDIQRRIVETAQMVVDVMGPGGLDEGGWGTRDAQKVRLMHAAVRHLVRRSGRWNPEWGEPVNQEDMAGTLLTFSVVTLRALRKLGYTPSAREAQAYYHTWRVVGFLMGVDERLLPASVEDGERLADLIFARVFAVSAEGQAMTRVLIERLDHLVPGNLFNGLTGTLIRHLVGDETADLLAVPPSDWSQSVLKPLRLLGWWVEGCEWSVLTTRMCELFGRKLLAGLVWVGRGGKRPPFRIPEVLQESWRVRDLEVPPIGVVGDEAMLLKRRSG
jgi:hypothetical protein